MARPQLNGTGVQKIKTLDEALIQAQTLHSIIERMALASKAQLPLQPFGQQLKRAAVPVASMLKGQFGSISDQVNALTLIATRGGNERVRISNLREGIAAVKQSIEIAARKVYEQDAIVEKPGRVET
ncbi:MAG: hypothetical protein H0W30_14300 [Gemmatimonadaceae bacterium]|nr:hypothetical protein [Gemmatimonadaceae bacterium]MDQ3518123.1 hypothetical protein [Gemmatimonadota bacterium]